MGSNRPCRRPRLSAVLGAAWAPLLVSGLALALAGGVLTVTDPLVGEAPGAPPGGVIHGWVAPVDARVLVPANVCQGNDALTTLTLSGAGTNTPSGVLPELVLEPPEVLVTGAAIDRGAEVKVLDVSAAMATHRPLSSIAEPYTHATARCRSWSEQSWNLGALSVSAVDRPLGAGEAITAYVVPQPTHTGVLALLMVHNYEQPVDIVSVALSAIGSTSDTVLAASGWMEHWEAWEQEALAWKEERRPMRYRSPPTRTDAPRPLTPPLEPTDPAPPLTWRPTNDLGLRLEPFNVAAIVIGEWTFREPGAAPGEGLFARAWHRLRTLASGRNEVVLTFPALTFRVDGVQSVVGMTEPLYAELP